jgi:hypothetical protein
MTTSDGYTVAPMTARVRAAARERGARPVAGHLARWGGQALAGLPWTLAGSRGRFEYQGQAYPYLYHRYKRSWLTERAVEVPVAQALVGSYAGRRVLEVGNVLSHFGPVQHTVVDKYERAPGVLNRDVLDLDELGPFDLIVAISTLEHVGWDERPRHPEKAILAAHALRERLAPGGQLFLTVPAGYNPSFDAALRAGELPLRRPGALRRTGAGASWTEVAPEAVWSAPYDFLLYRANGVLFAFVER